MVCGCCTALRWLEMHLAVLLLFLAAGGHSRIIIMIEMLRGGWVGGSRGSGGAVALLGHHVGWYVGRELPQSTSYRHAGHVP